ncbi:MAG: hypothetical protein IPL61_36490 [Myxococcales bacterium]|nr:hypothetical protein [Myxococcales bacterium]
MLDRLDLGVAIDEVECRTSICRIRLTAGRHVVDERVAGTVPWADSVSHTVIETEAGPAIEVLAAYTEETRDQATFEQLSSGLLERVEPTLVEVRDRALRGDAGIR